MLGKIRSSMHGVNESSLVGGSTANLAKLLVLIGGCFSLIMFVILLYWEI